nr:hypothetical protein [Streptomyces sp. RPA4-2]QIY60363.1 hypothetical protein HEP85_01195 [Streptomyces sp. RPA4-2]
MRGHAGAARGRPRRDRPRRGARRGLSRDGELLAEVLWSAWHGLAALTGGRRLRPGLTGRLAALTEVLLGPAAQPA